VSGSAGGAGAGYYVKARYDRLSQSRTPRVPAGLRLVSPGWSETVPRDSESAVIRSIALAEIWRKFDPRPVRGAPPNDRGRELERQWEQLSQLPLEELRAAERAGLVPSLILAPTTLEDGRRLFISNLDLLNLAPSLAVQQVQPLAPRPLSRGLVLCGGSELLFSREAWSAVQGTPALVDFVDDLESGRDLYSREVDASGPAGAPRPPAGRRNPVRPSDVAQTNYSLTGVEFARAFDRANGFRLATAARMSATAPMISPAVYLPSDPELRVADSGFYDNYGMDVAAAWLFRNRCWLKANTSGVLLVQIRAMGRREMRTGVVPPAAGFFPQFFKGFRLVGSVAEGGGARVLHRGDLSQRPPGRLARRAVQQSRPHRRLLHHGRLREHRGRPGGPRPALRPGVGRRPGRTRRILRRAELAADPGRRAVGPRGFPRVWPPTDVLGERRQRHPGRGQGPDHRGRREWSAPLPRLRRRWQGGRGHR